MSSSCVGSSVELRCTRTRLAGGVVICSAYRLLAIASSVTCGSLDYLRRRLQASVSRAPP